MTDTPSSPAASGAPPKPAGAARRRGRPPLREADLANRRERVMDAACRLFLTIGFAETTLEAIGREAGVTKRTIYELCGDKSDLFRAACESLRVEGPYFSFDVAVAGRPTRDVLLDMAHQLVDHSFKPHRLAIARVVMAETVRFPDLVGRVFTDGRDSLRQGIARVFTQLIAEGAAPPFSTREAAMMFYDVAVGVAGLRASLGCDDERPTDEQIAIRVDMFLNGYLRDRAQEAASATEKSTLPD